MKVYPAFFFPAAPCFFVVGAGVFLPVQPTILDFSTSKVTMNGSLVKAAATPSNSDLR